MGSLLSSCLERSSFAQRFGLLSLSYVRLWKGESAVRGVAPSGPSVLLGGPVPSKWPQDRTWMDRQLLVLIFAERRENNI